MKIFAPVLAALATTIYAAPVAVPIDDVSALNQFDTRQAVGSTANEFKLNGCRDVLFFFARGSTEAGNMVSSHFNTGGSI